MLDWNGEQIKRDVADSVYRALLKGAITVEGRAAVLAPVDTGNLRNSITYVISGESEVFPEGIQLGDEFTLQPGEIITAKEGEAIIGTILVYAPAVEFGTIYQVAQPFLLPAFRDSLPDIQRFFAEEIGSIKWIS